MEPVFRNVPTTDWITFTIFGSLLLVVVAKTFFYPRFLNFIILPFNNKYIFMYNRKEKLFNWFQVFLTVFQIINISLFAFLAFKAYTFMIVNNIFLYPIILGLFSLFLVVKSIIQLGNGFIFESYQVFNEILFKKLSYLNYGAFILFIANILLTYVFLNSKIVVGIAFILFLTVNIIGWSTIIKSHQKFIADYFVYFILYLCALEIAPLILLGSLLK